MTTSSAVQAREKPSGRNVIASWARAHQVFLITLGSLIAIVILLWIPTGWHVSDVSDNWAFFNYFEQGTDPVGLGSLRPFSYVADWLQYALTPNSWLGSNVLLALLLVLKGLAVFALVRELIPRQPVIAYAVSVLYTVYFADLGVFLLVAVNIHAATLFAVLAAWLLLRQWRAPHITNIVFMVVCQILALSYEGVYGIVFLSPLLLVLPARGVNRRVLKLGALYLIAPVIILARYAFLMAQTTTAYQSGQVNVALQGDVPRAFVNSLWRIYRRVLGLVWYDYRDTAAAYPSYWILAGVAGLITAAGCAAITRNYDRTYPGWRSAVVFILAGLIIIGVGFAPFLISEFRDVDYRVYFGSMIGSSLIMVAGLFCLTHSRRRVRLGVLALCILSIVVVDSRLVIGLAISFGVALVLLNARWMFILSLAALVTMNTYFTLAQHVLYAEAPLIQHWMFSDIIEQAPQPADGTMIVVLDETDGTNSLRRFDNRVDIFHNALQFLFENPTVQGSFCVPGAAPYGLFREACAFEDDGYHYTLTQNVQVIPYERLLVFTYDDLEGLRLLESLPAAGDRYQPLSIAGRGSPFPDRAASLLSDFPTPRPDIIVEWSQLH